ncbi:sulfite exporter TauE/SafE family protein [Vibrio sp. RC27]
MEWFNTTTLFIGSLISNTMASLSGGGAGLLQFPLLIFLGLPFSIALATHKLASVALGLGATITHLKRGGLSYGFISYLIVIGSIGVITGAHLVLLIPGDIAEKGLGITILSLGIYSRVKKQLGQEDIPVRRDTKGYILGALFLIVIGVINGSIAAGSGLLVTIFLVRWFGYSYKQAIALTMISVGLCWNGIGAAAITVAGAEIYWAWLPILLAGSFLGGSLGAYLMKRLSNSSIKIAFEILTFAVGIKLLL